ncbi:hypothetical protein LSPH24S_08884 [Lysinibacillus sphaericus]
MKIKSWLLMMFFIVMIVPIGGAYGLYIWIDAYYHDKSFAEYIVEMDDTKRCQVCLNDPTLYAKDADIQQVKVLTSDQLAITLYAKSGFVYYSSNPLTSGFVSRENVLKNLYVLQQKYNAFTYKEPVFQQSVELAQQYCVGYRLTKEKMTNELETNNTSWGTYNADDIEFSWL